MKELIERIVRRMVSWRLDYLAAYPATVVAQDALGHLDVIPDSPRLPPMTGVEIRYGVPGVTARVKKDSRVYITFEGGNPELPVATIWHEASVSELVVNGDLVKVAGGNRGIARKGDMIAVTLTPAHLEALGATVAKPPPLPSVQVHGLIITGSDNATAR